jgi:cobalt-zinc-cadmium efflux system membrane fusion protein
LDRRVKEDIFVNLARIRMVGIWVSMTVCVLFTASCGLLGGSEEGAEEKTAQVTVWSERFEIFLEHRLIVANRPTKFITHVSDLVTLEPRREGAVTFILRPGSGTPLTHVEPKPARDGIYIPELTFPTPGEWHVSLLIPLAGGDYTVELPPLMVFVSADEAARAPEPESPEGISFLKEQQWKIRTGTEPVTKRPVTERLRLAGVVAVRPGSKATVTPPVAGQLAPPPGLAWPQLGSRVEAGQVLGLIQPHLVGSDLLTFLNSQQQIQAMELELTVKGAEAEAEAIRSRVGLTQVEQVLQRVQTLFKQNARSARELEEAEFAVRKTKADLSAAEALKTTYERAKKQLAGRPRVVEPTSGMPAVELKAPIAGLITAVNATVGEHLPTDHAVFSIVNTETVLIEAQVPEWDLGRLSASHGATYEASHTPGSFVPILGDEGGAFIYLGSSVDEKRRTVSLVYEVPNPDGHLRIGMSLQVYVETARVEEALAIPTSALVDEDGRAVVFVQLSGETFEKRDLTLGIRDGVFVQVLSGVSEGERVVTQGAYAIRLASVSTIIPAHGHSH